MKMFLGPMGRLSNLNNYLLCLSIIDDYPNIIGLFDNESHFWIRMDYLYIIFYNFA